MNLAKVHYRKENDESIYVVKLDSFLSQEEMEKRHSIRAVIIYRAKAHYMFSRNSRHVSLTINGCERQFFEGHSFDPIDFALLISNMKTCGANFIASIRQARKEGAFNGEIKVIEI